MRSPCEDSSVKATNSHCSCWLPRTSSWTVACWTISSRSTLTVTSSSTTWREAILWKAVDFRMSVLIRIPRRVRWTWLLVTLFRCTAMLHSARVGTASAAASSSIAPTTSWNLLRSFITSCGQAGYSSTTVRFSITIATRLTNSASNQATKTWRRSSKRSDSLSSRRTPKWSQNIPRILRRWLSSNTTRCSSLCRRRSQRKLVHRRLHLTMNKTKLTTQNFEITWKPL